MFSNSCVVNHCYTPTPDIWENRTGTRTFGSAYTWINGLVCQLLWKRIRDFIREEMEFRARLIEKGTEKEKRGARCVLQQRQGKRSCGHYF